MTGVDLMLAAGLGFLLALDPFPQAALFSPRRGLHPRAGRVMLSDLVFLVLVPCVLVPFGELVRAFLLPLSREGLFAVWLFAAGSAAAAAAGKKSPALALAAFLLALRGLPAPEAAGHAARFAVLPVLAAAVTAFRFLLLGMRDKMLLADTPSAVRGLPLLLLLASAISVLAAALLS